MNRIGKRTSRISAWTISAMLCAVLLGHFALGMLMQGAWSAEEIAGATIADATVTDTGIPGEEATGMTLFDLLSSGGWVVVVLVVLSVLALALALYFTVVLREKRMLPPVFINQIRHFLRDGRYEDVARLCRRTKGMFAKVIMAGITRGVHDPKAASEMMEAIGRREAEGLMRKVRYLSDIATVAPMLGLLGTVLGMINAFNFIAFDISAVKPVALASAVAQALVTTAVGLIVAIPSMGFFFYFRGKLQSMVAQMEEVSVEIADYMVVAQTQQPSEKRSRRKTSSRPPRRES